MFNGRNGGPQAKVCGPLSFCLLMAYRDSPSRNGCVPELGRRGERAGIDGGNVDSSVKTPISEQTF